MIADLPKNREIGAGWMVSLVFQGLLRGRFTEYWPALFSFSYGMPVISVSKGNESDIFSIRPEKASQAAPISANSKLAWKTSDALAYIGA